MSTVAQPELDWRGDDVTIGDVLKALTEARRKFAIANRSEGDEHPHPRRDGQHPGPRVLPAGRLCKRRFQPEPSAGDGVPQRPHGASPKFPRPATTTLRGRPFTVTVRRLSPAHHPKSWQSPAYGQSGRGAL